MTTKDNVSEIGHPAAHVKAVRHITPSLVRMVLDYDPDTGILTWKERGPEWSRGPSHLLPSWNRRFAGKPAMENINGHGYKHGTILGVSIYAHKVVFMHYHDRIADMDIDHINGVKSDNRIENLREVPRQQNCRNQRLSRRNKSGVTGVRWITKIRKWRVGIQGNEGKELFLGEYNTFEEAVAVRECANKLLGYDENHGKKRGVA